MSDPQIEITAVCDVHQGSGPLVVRRKGDRIVLDGHADDCCVISLSDPAAALLFDVLGEVVGQRDKVVGRGCESLFVRFSDHAVRSVPPRVLRVLPTTTAGEH